MRKPLSILLLFLLLFVYFGHLSQAAPPLYPRQQGPVWEITSPGANARLRGTTEIRGSAYLGEIFQFYKVEYQPLGAPPDEWIVFSSATEQVRDGHLGWWDTTIVPDGTYNLKLTVVKKDGNYEQTSPRQVVVANAEPTATPTPTETPTPTPTVVLVTPTVVVVQPTVVRFTPTPTLVATRTSLPEIPSSIPLPDMGIVFNSFLFGALVAGALFAFIIIVTLIRRLI
jgi:hypothetical protein